MDGIVERFVGASREIICTDGYFVLALLLRFHPISSVRMILHHDKQTHKYFSQKSAGSERVEAV
jgi:hypothetical protein